MILGLGTDLVEVPRISRSIEAHGDRFIQRVFTRSESAYAKSKANSAERFAARFAAKEAVMKALGTGWAEGVGWCDIEVSNHPSGKPTLTLHGLALRKSREMGVKRIWLSMTHTSQMACAMVIFED